MKLLTALFLLIALPMFGAVPAYTSFRGTGGILITSNPPTGNITIDGSGVVATGTNSTINIGTNSVKITGVATQLNIIIGTNMYIVATNVNNIANVQFNSTALNSNQVIELVTANLLTQVILIPELLTTNLVIGGTVTFYGVNGFITNVVNGFTNAAAGLVGLLGPTNFGNVRVKGLAAGANVTLTDQVTNILIASTGGGSGSGETNVNGEISVTNSTRFGLVYGKAGVTNLLRSISPRNGLVGTNEGGTNIAVAIDPTIVASQVNLTAASNAVATTIAAGTNIVVITNGTGPTVYTIHSTATGTAGGTNGVALPLWTFQFNSNGTMQGSPGLLFTNGGQTVIKSNAIYQPSSGTAGRVMVAADTGGTMVYTDAVTLVTLNTTTLNANTLNVTNGITATPAAPISSVQFNSNGVMQGSLKLTFTNGNLAIGTNVANEALDVFGKIGIRGTQMVYFPDQVYYRGNLFIGDGGQFITNSVPFTNNNSGDSDFVLAVGIGAGKALTTGSENTLIGAAAGEATTTGKGLALIGSGAGQASTVASFNVMIGADCGIHNVDGSNNVYIGNGTASLGVHNQRNTWVGYNAGANSTNGNDNVGFGMYAGLFTQTNENTYVGNIAGYSNIAGYLNTAIGFRAMWQSSIGNAVTAVGRESLSDNVNGSYLTAIGYQAGYNSGVTLSSITNGVFVGYRASGSANSLTNVVAIGDNAIVIRNNQAVLGANTITETILNGNVGVGTVNPTAKLHVYSTTAGGSQVFVQSTAAGAFPYVGLANPSHTYYLYLNGSAGDAFQIYDVTAGVIRMHIDTSGNVGIGTTTPTNKFDVSGSASIRTDLFLPNLPTNASPVAFLAVDSGGKVYETATPSGGSAGTNIPVGQIIYLDAAFGSDATASRTNLLRPYLTASNAVAAMLSGDTLVVRGGTYLINPKASSATDLGNGQNKSAGVALTNLSNVRIVGEPGSIWQMSSFYSNALHYSCPMLNLTRCTNVVIEGLTMSGIRTNAIVLQDSGILLTDCDNVEFRNVTIKNWQCQGVSDLSQTTINRNLRCINSEFRDIGGTNQIILGVDGTAWSAIATNIVFVNNRMFYNNRDFEECCNADARGLIYEGNYSVGCYGIGIVLHATNASEMRIVNNIYVGYATNQISGGASWLAVWSASNIVIQGNQIGGYTAGLVYNATAGSRFVDVQILDNVFHDFTYLPMIMEVPVGNSAEAARVSIMRNKFKNSSSVALAFGGIQNSRIEQNEFDNCNSALNNGGIIMLGWPIAGVSTNATNVSVVGNKFYGGQSSLALTSIVVYSQNYSNVIYGNDVSRIYQGKIHDLGVGTRSRPVNMVGTGKLLYANTNGDEAAVTIGSGVAFDGITGTLTGTGSGTPGGANRSIQWNTNGVFGGNGNMQYDPLGFFSEFVGPTISINNSGGTNFFSPQGFGTLGPSGFGFTIYTDNTLPRWNYLTGGHHVPATSNSVDQGSYSLPVRTNWVNDVVVKNLLVASSNAATHATIAPAALHSVALGKGWTNDLGARADIIMSVKFVDAVTGDPALAFTNAITGEAWTNTIVFGAVVTAQYTIVVPDISPNDRGSFTDVSTGSGSTLTILNAWWKTK